MNGDLTLQTPLHDVIMHAYRKLLATCREGDWTQLSISIMRGDPHAKHTPSRTNMLTVRINTKGRITEQDHYFNAEAPHEELLYPTLVMLNNVLTKASLRKEEE